MNRDSILCVCPNTLAQIRALFGPCKARQFLPTTPAPFARLRLRSDNRRYSPMSDVNGDREEEPVPGLSTSPAR